jgi:hypothetical protein
MYGGRRRYLLGNPLGVCFADTCRKRGSGTAAAVQSERLGGLQRNQSGGTKPPGRFIKVIGYSPVTSSLEITASSPASNLTK